MADSSSQEHGSFISRQWFLRERFDVGYRDFGKDVDNSILSFSPQKKLNLFIKREDIVAASERERKLFNKVAKNVIEDGIFEKLKQSQKAKVLLFADWNSLSPQKKDDLEKEFGSPVYDDLDVVPSSGIIDVIQETCGEMEMKMKGSRERVLIGKRLLLKLYGTDAAISDRMIVTKRGNILIPFVWYQPDEIFLNFVHQRHESSDGPMTNSMKDWPLVGFQVLRHSPAFLEDEGWDSVKHSLTGGFKNLHDSQNGLTSIIETHLQESE